MSAQENFNVEQTVKEDCERLVFGVDIGTTQSGAAFAYVSPDGHGNRVPTVLENLHGQNGGRPKVPSLLLYDEDGSCLEKWGTDLEKASPRDLRNFGNGKKVYLTQWFKLHIDPEHSRTAVDFGDDETKQLPPFRTAYDVWGDMLRKITASAKETVKQDFGLPWLGEVESRGKIRFIVTVPVAWQKDPRTIMELRKQAVRVGLVNAKTLRNLVFCSESEASALHCYEEAKCLNLKRGEKFLVVDAGGGTIDFTCYRVTQGRPLEVEEVDDQSKVCLYNGSTFVDQGFAETIEGYLTGKYPTDVKAVTPYHLRRAIAEFAIEKPSFSSHKKEELFWNISGDGFDNDTGYASISWEFLEKAFKPHVEAILEATSRICRELEPQYLFLSGGFGDSPYLRERIDSAVKTRLQVVRPDVTSSSSGSRAVCLGGCLSGMRTWVKTREASLCIGICAETPISLKKSSKYPGRVQKQYGEWWHVDRFDPIVSRNERVSAEGYRTKPYTFKNIPTGPQKGFIEVYTCTGETPAEYIDGPGTTKVGELCFTFPKSTSCAKRRTTRDGTDIIEYNCDVRIYPGETEFRAAVYTKDGQIVGESAYLRAIKDEE